MKHPVKKRPRSLYVAAVCLLPLVLAACPQPQTVGKQAQVRKKEVYPYPHNATVGSLGGIPIRFSSYITHGPVSYEDTPTAFSPEWKTYKRPKRTLQSVITGFGFDLNLETGKIFDLRKDSISGFYEERGKPNTPWASVVFSADTEPYLPDYLSRIFDKDFKGENIGLEVHPYRNTNQKLYGLEVYTAIGTDSSGRTATMFIARDRQGNVKTHIKCVNVKVPNPPCKHLFVSPASRYILFSLGYNRQHLKDWQRAEKLVNDILAEFADNAKHPERKL